MIKDFLCFLLKVKMLTMVSISYDKINLTAQIPILHSTLPSKFSLYSFQKFLKTEALKSIFLF